MPSIPIFALSSKGENVSELGSTFTYRFKSPLRIPAEAEDATISLVQSAIWYVQPNISSALGNNQMVLSYANLNDGDEFTITFEDGLYSLPALQSALKSKLYNLNSELTGLTGEEITMIPDNAQQKLIFSLKPTDITGPISMYFGGSDFTMKSFLGYENNEDFAAINSGLTSSTIGDSTAKFNGALSYFIMHCSLSAGSYDSDGDFNGSQIAQMFPINISPGSQLVHIPNNPLKCSANIAGQTISSCTFSVTNQNGVLQDMRGEEFSALVVLEY
jgi:hypothetical protein